MPEKPLNQCNQSDVVEIYKLLVEMADRVSQRRQSANSFYLTVNTAIIGGTAYLSQSNIGEISSWAVSVAGVAICFLWIRAIASYKSLNSAKFKVITALEAKLSVSAFSDEWKILKKSETGKRHKPFHETEVLVPIVFIGVHVAQVIASFPCEKILNFFGIDTS